MAPALFELASPGADLEGRAHRLLVAVRGAPLCVRPDCTLVNALRAMAMSAGAAL
jgi:hypothetical protein